MKTHYRVIQDDFLGYSPQVKYWRCPFLLPIYIPNTYSTLQECYSCNQVVQAGSKKEKQNYILLRII